VSENREKSEEKPMRPGGRGGLLKTGGSPGRPPGSLSIIGGIKKKLEEHPEMYEALIMGVLAQAAEGNAQALRQIMDRLDGPIKEQIDTNQTVRVVFGEPQDE
jgi:hypothetical protein